MLVSPFGSEKVRLPRSFTMLGQKFVLDSWVEMSKVVYDDIIWEGDKVQRRVPSGLDAAFAALGNDATVSALAGRMTDRDGRKFRDGLNYQHNLAAVRNVIDSQKAEAWDEKPPYMNWLATPRELSKPTTDAKYPEAMRTQAWAMKTLNTQMASWTQLRHDTILYVKQSYTAVPSCVYPAGYVEPVPHFCAAGEDGRPGGRVDREDELPRSELRSDREPQWGRPAAWSRKGEKVTYRGKDTFQEASRRQKFLRNFAKQVGIIRGIAEKELAEKELEPPTRRSS